MLPYFVTVTLLIAQASADANILAPKSQGPKVPNSSTSQTPNLEKSKIPNAYYAGNLAGYSGFSGYTSPYFSYQSRYPSQQSQYNTRSIYQQPKPQYNYNTVAKNDPYAANPHVTKLRPAYNNHYNYNRKVQQPKPYKSYGYKTPTYVAPAKTAKPVAPKIVKPVAPTTTVAPRIVTTTTVAPRIVTTTAKPFTVRPVPAVPVTKAPVKLVSKPIDNQIQEEETVLDFSSGSAQEVENTATEVKQTTTIETTNGFEILTKGYEKLGLDQELAGIGNITIFAPRDDDFKKAGIDIDNIDDVALRALILKHLVRGTLERKDLNGQVQTLAGVPITLTKNDKGKLIIISNGKTTKLKITNVRTKWGIVHVIDSVLA